MIRPLVRPWINFWRSAPGSIRGIVYMVVSTLAFSSMHILVRFLSAEIDPLQISFFRNLFGTLVFLPWILRYGLTPLRQARHGLHWFRAVVNVIAMFAFFTALSLTPVAEVTALAFTAPIFAALLGLLVLGETFRLRRWIAIAVGFAGTLVVLRPGLAPTDPGTLLALASALLWGGVLIMIKVLSRTESSMTITLYMSILLSLLSFGPALFVWTAPDLTHLFWLLVIGTLGSLGQVAVTQSLKETETNVVMPFDFLKLIWAALLGFLIFAEVPNLFVWLGGAMIFASASYMAYRENQLATAGKARRAAAPDRT